MFLTRDNLRAAIALVVSETFARRDEAAVGVASPTAPTKSKGEPPYFFRTVAPSSLGHH
jgi:hypothetical protein